MEETVPDKVVKDLSRSVVNLGLKFLGGFGHLKWLASDRYLHEVLFSTECDHDHDTGILPP